MGHSSTDYESTDKDKYNVNLSNMRRSIRKGDTIYYSKPENINMIKGIEKIPNSSTTQSSVETIPKHEKILSGESLYKAFTFEQSPNDEETEKCIAFWKSVMEKNLSPIKCSIIESKRKQSSNSEEKINKQTQMEGSTESLSKNFEEQIINLENEIKKIHKQYREMWSDILIELQKKKMNEVKMIGQSRCKICEPMKPNCKESDERKDKQDTLKEIQELSNWISRGRKQRVGASSSIQSDTSDKCMKRTDSYQLSEDGQEKQAVIEPRQTSWADITKPEPPLNFEFKDIIEEKKEKGIYRKWQVNKLKEPCECVFAATCTCNKNAAIESVTCQTAAGASSSAQSDTSDKRMKHTDSCQLPEDAREKQDLIEPGQTSWADITKTEPPLNFEFKKIIEEKIEKGIYSKWRVNKLEEPCECGFATTCICNKNPAIESVTCETVAEPSKSALKLPSLSMVTPRNDIEIPAIDPKLRKKIKCESVSSLKLIRNQNKLKQPMEKKTSSDELITLLQLPRNH